jgi:PAS domain S-box-containing protein
MSPRTALHRPERLPRKDAVDATHVAVLPERSPAETANNDAMPAHMDESGYPLGLERFRILPGEAGGVKEGLQRWLNLKQPLNYSALCRTLRQCAPDAGLVYFSQLLKHLVDKRRMASRTEARIISVKRVYEPSAPLDGVRLLVERLWPRGMRKEPLRMEAWLKGNSLRGREGSYRSLERRAERIFGFSPSEAIRQSLDIIIPENLRKRHWDGYHATVLSGLTRYGAGDILAVPALRKDANPLSIEFTILPFLDDTGRIVGIAAVLRDVTKRFKELKELRKALASSQAAQSQ